MRIYPKLCTTRIVEHAFAQQKHFDSQWQCLRQRSNDGTSPLTVKERVERRMMSWGKISEESKIYMHESVYQWKSKGKYVLKQKCKGDHY